MSNRNTGKNSNEGNDSNNSKVGKMEQLPSRIHIREFLFGTNLSDMQKAGFGAFVGNKEWMRPTEWEDNLKKYKSE